MVTAGPSSAVALQRHSPRAHQSYQEFYRLQRAAQPTPRLPLSNALHCATATIRVGFSRAADVTAAVN